MCNVSFKSGVNPKARLLVACALADIKASVIKGAGLSPVSTHHYWQQHCQVRRRLGRAGV